MSGLFLLYNPKDQSLKSIVRDAVSCYMVASGRKEDNLLELLEKTDQLACQVLIVRENTEAIAIYSARLGDSDGMRSLPQSVEIKALFLVNPKRSKGMRCAELLYRKVEEFAREQMAVGLHLFVDASSTSEMIFYQSQGFREEGSSEGAARTLLVKRFC